MNIPKKRIGFILASIHTGSALSLWPSLARQAEQTGIHFVIFPGGRLDYRPDSDFLRNSVYRLANPENLDGLISWGSSIGGAVSIEELDTFHEAFSPLPYVTIAHKMSGHPCVLFDAYTGMRNLVNHFIRVHGSKRIAFLRGPVNHESAMDRYRAFRDAMADAGIDPGDDSQLISSPFAWGDGEAAAAQLYDERGLVPGQDFDALICSSDMMAFSAVRYLEKFGYRVPQDYRAGGFNDSAESRIPASPFSTVRMPFTELGLVSFQVLRSMLSGGESIPDCILPAEMIIRESCGCQAGKSAEIRGGAPRTAADLSLGLSELFHLDETDRNAVIEPLVSALAAADSALFLRLLDRALLRFFDEDRDLSLLYGAIAIVKDCPAIPHEPLGTLETSVCMLISRVQNRVQALKQFVASKRYAVLNSLKCDLLCARDRGSLVAILNRHLPQIGIRSCAVVLYESASHSRYIGGFSDEGIQTDSDQLFPATLVLPPRLIPQLSVGVTMVLPLFMEYQPLGYFVTTVPFYEGTMYEDLRSAISSALKGVFLFEEAARARENAERAERTKTEFFANVGGELCDPLHEILERLRRAETVLEGETPSLPELREDLRWLESKVRAQSEKTNSLIDLTLALSNELGMEKKLFAIADIVPEAGTHPLVCGDPARFAQAFASVRNICPGPIAAYSRPEGLSLRFASDEPLDTSAWHSPDALLAEKIVLMQYGHFAPQDRGCEILLPWPNLAGLPPAKAAGVPSRIRSLSPDLDLGEFGLPAEQVSDPSDPEGLLLAWNCDTARMDEWLAVYALRQDAALFRAPFLCYGKSLSGDSLIAGIEAKVRERSRGPILFVGFSRDEFSDWADQSDGVYVSDAEALCASLREIEPSLIVFDRVCPDDISRARMQPRAARVPVLVLPERLESGPELEALCRLPRVIACNRSVAASPEFSLRVKGLLSGDEILPPHTGALVKMAVLFLNAHASRQIARWKLADSVNVSEDYLTRIFHREMGISLWEYLNRYRIALATDLLLRTNLTIYEIALRTGFQDQAYFCRVFKKIHGVPPGKIRGKG